MPRRPRRLLGALVALLAAAGCGEPAVDLELPARDPGQHVLDTAGILDGTDIADRLADLAEEGLDVVAVTYETPRASLGESRRAGQLIVEEWDADIALVAVARPDDFTSTDDETRRRFFGLEPADSTAVPRGLRERVAEQRAPPLAEVNDWPGVFAMAIDELERELVGDVRLVELEAVCREAARGLVEREGRPVPATVVLPLPDTNRVITLPAFPADEAGRTAVLERLVRDVVRPTNASCFGFVAEATIDAGDDDPVDVVVVAYSARQRHAHVTAAPLDVDGVGTFTTAEELDPAAMPFLAPLQAAVDAAGPPDAFGGVLPTD